MHFKSDWQKNFESETFKEDFQRSNGIPTKVDMMYGEFDDLGYVQTNIGAQIVAVPFEDTNYQMVLVLPPENTGEFYQFHL